MGFESGVLIIDPGSYAFRMGFSHEKRPVCEIPSTVGVEEVVMSDWHLDNYQSVGPLKRYFIGEQQLCVPRPDVNVTNYINNCMIEDWDLFERVLDYAYKRELRVEPKSHPVLISEAPWNIKQKREALAELMFEKFEVPSFFIMKNAVLAAYANKRTSCLIVDSGATHTSVVPIQDGNVLKRGLAKSPFGSDNITAHCKHTLQEMGIEIVPPCMIESKELVEPGEQPKFVKKQNMPLVTQSWYNYMTNKSIFRFQTEILQISSTPFDSMETEHIKKLPYEFPTGYNQKFGSERFSIPELVFDPSGVEDRGGIKQPSMLGIGSTITTALLQFDTETKAMLYNNVVLTGGNTTIPGFMDRLRNEIAMRIPASAKLKVTCAKNKDDRRLGAWIGGSIIGSIDNLEQLWITAEDYKEKGKGLVTISCP